MSTDQSHLVQTLWACSPAVPWFLDGRCKEKRNDVSNNGEAKAHEFSTTGNSLAFVAKPISVGIVPSSIFVWSQNSSALKPKISVGIVPVNLISDNRNSRKFGDVNRPNSDGMVPLMDVCAKAKYCKFVKSPSSVGMVPTACLLSPSQSDTNKRNTTVRGRHSPNQVRNGTAYLRKESDKRASSTGTVPDRPLSAK